LTTAFLPNYVKGIEAARIYALSSISLIYFGVSIIIPVVRRNMPLMIGYAIAIALLWGLGLYFVQQGFGIVGVAWARLVASVFICLFSLSYSYYLTTLDIRS